MDNKYIPLPSAFWIGWVEIGTFTTSPVVQLNEVRFGFGEI